MEAPAYTSEVPTFLISRPVSVLASAAVGLFLSLVLGPFRKFVRQGVRPSVGEDGPGNRWAIREQGDACSA